MSSELDYYTMSQKIYKRSARDAYEDENRLTSMTEEFYFVVYSTYTGNRTTLAIYRNADGERKEVNFVLSFKQVKNIGKRIKKGIADLRKRPINKLYQTYIEFHKINYYGSNPEYQPSKADLVILPTTTISMKQPNETKDESLIQPMNDGGYKHDFVEYKQLVCRICQTYGDCIVMRDIPVCDLCKTKDDFKERFQVIEDKHYDSVGGISPRKYSWCRRCNGGEDSREMNEFGVYCKNPDCQSMIICDTCNIFFNDDCRQKEHEGSHKKRSLTFDLTVEQRVCRKCLNYGDCQTIGKKAICQKCKQLRIERFEK